MADQELAAGAKLLRTREGLCIRIEHDSRAGYGELVDFMRGRRFAGVDYAALKDAFKIRRGQVVLLIKAEHLASLDAVIEVSVSGDEMEAEARYSPPRALGRELDDEELLKRLKARGVEFGIKIDAPARLREAAGRWAVVARGRAPVDEAPIRILPVLEPRPTVLESAERMGAAADLDFSRFEFVRRVQGGDLVGRLESPIGQRANGVTVTGKTLPALRRLDPGIGPITALDGDGVTLRAAFWGQYVHRGDEIGVYPVNIMAREDLLGHKTIGFAGTIVCECDIEDGYAITAERDILVKGAVGRSRLEAGGDIFVIGGPVSAAGSEIEAGGDIVVRGVQGGRFWARGSVLVNGRAVNAGIGAWGRVVVNGREGVIVGGEVLAGTGISARAVASDNNEPARLEAGSMKIEVQQRKARAAEAATELKSLAAAMIEVDELLAGFCPAFRREQLDERKRLIEARMQAAKQAAEGPVDARCADGAFIEIERPIPPETILLVGATPFAPSRPMEHVRLVAEDGEIIARESGQAVELEYDLLKPGMVILESVTDRFGNTLLPKRARLTTRDLRRLQKHGVESLKVLAAEPDKH